ncbi:MAG TPA: hypothetical protein VGF17_12680 [Phytomonospora sp.]
MAAGHRRPEPIDFPRPGVDPAQRGPAEGLTGSTDTGLHARGLGGMLAAAQVYGVVAAPVSGPGHE